MGEILPFNMTIWFIAKILVLFAILVYVVFAGVVVKQIRVMTETVKMGFEKPLKAMSIVHLIVSLAVFILALVIL